MPNGCAFQPPESVRVGSTRQESAFSIAAARTIQSAAVQVKRCYRTPRVAHAAKQIVTRLRVRYAADGTLSGLPTILSQSGVTPANEAYSGLMGEAAVLAVIRCSPLKLPPELYARGWDEFELTFSPVVAA